MSRRSCSVCSLQTGPSTALQGWCSKGSLCVGVLGARLSSLSPVNCPTAGQGEVVDTGQWCPCTGVHGLAMLEPGVSASNRSLLRQRRPEPLAPTFRPLASVQVSPWGSLVAGHHTLIGGGVNGAEPLTRQERHLHNADIPPDTH